MVKEESMKRLSFVLAVLLLCAANVYALTAPSNVEVEATQTTLTFTWDALDSTTQANSDSLVIIDPSDSTVAATCDSVSQVTITLTGLIPGKQYIYAVAADSAAEAFGISTPDTSTTTALVFTMSAGANDKTDIAITISAIDDTTGIDSLCIVNMADSELVKFYLTTNTTSATISGLSPLVTYSWYVADGINGNIISNGDTLQTKGVDIDNTSWQPWDPRYPMRSATSNHSASKDTTYIVLHNAADEESTQVYQAATYTNVYGYADGPADSTIFTALLYAGYVGNDAHSTNKMDVALVDSVNVTAAGEFDFGGVSFNGIKAHFFVKFRGDTDCGATVTIYPLVAREALNPRR